MCSLLVIFLIENYTELFYVIHKRYVPFFQRKTILYQSTTMREIDGLGIIFIDIHVPALTS
jgi:hypothetical protein